MENTTAKIRLSFENNEIEVIGSENFVDKQISELKDLLFLNRESNINQETDSIKEKDKENLTNKKEPPIKEDIDYSEIFAFEDGKLRILLHQAPGKNYREQTKNITYLYLFGNLINNITEVNTKDIKEVCKLFSCLDSTNFMKALRDEKRGFIISKAEGRSFTIKLSQPGKKIARELVEELLDQ